MLLLLSVMIKKRDRILVVEDDVDACQLFGMVLSQAGYTVELARDAFEALASAAARRPDQSSRSPSRSQE